MVATTSTSPSGRSASKEKSGTAATRRILNMLRNLHRRPWLSRTTCLRYSTSWPALSPGPRLRWHRAVNSNPGPRNRSLTQKPRRGPSLPRPRSQPAGVAALLGHQLGVGHLPGSLPLRLGVRAASMALTSSGAKPPSWPGAALPSWPERPGGGLQLRDMAADASLWAKASARLASAGLSAPRPAGRRAALVCQKRLFLTLP